MGAELHSHIGLYLVSRIASYRTPRLGELGGVSVAMKGFF